MGSAIVSHVRTLDRRSDPQVVGRAIRVQRGTEPVQLTLEIVGVMPEGFEFPRGVDLWLPAAPGVRASAKPNPADPDDVAWFLANYRIFYAIGTLRDGVTREQADDELGRIMSKLQQGNAAGSPSDAVVTAIDDYVLGPAKIVLWMMLAGAGMMMMLLACSSVAGLHLFRSARQDRAIAIQLALGASRWRLTWRALIESALVAFAGAIGAVAIAWLTTRAIVLMAPMDVPRLATATVAAPAVLGLIVGLVIITSMLSGVWPVLFIGHVDAGRTLTAGTRTAMGPRERIFQRAVVGWQIAVAVVLLSGAALFIRSVQQLNRTPLGFNAEGLMAVEL